MSLYILIYIILEGTQEDGLINNQINKDDYVLWSQFIDNTRKSWYEVGLGRDVDVSVSKSNLAFIKLSGGMHGQVSWDNILYEGLKLLYSNEYNYSYHRHSSETTRRLSLNQNFDLY